MTLTKKKIVILGATGSIGTSTLSVIDLNTNYFEVVGLSAFSNMKALAALALKYQPLAVAVPDKAAELGFRAYYDEGLNDNPYKPIIYIGEQGLCALAALKEASHVVAAIVGSAGLPSAMAAAHSGKTILLANKESLVMTGALFLEAVKQGGATLLPLDSEHNALFQCLPNGRGQVNHTVRSVWITASGGPFLNHTPEQLNTVTPEQACKHPKWSMGQKISVDSATLMNKGLEVIEAAFLYGLSADKIKVAIHPQSTIHALVQYIDGSVLSHLSCPDMRVPIAHALAYNHNDNHDDNRIESGVKDLNMCELSGSAGLQFFEPDLKRFPCLALAYQALAMGQYACIALNASNEIVVESFLKGQLPFTQISNIVAHILNTLKHQQINTIEDVYDLDKKIREETLSIINKQS